MGGQGKQAYKEEPEKNSTQPSVVHLRQRPFRFTDAEGPEERRPTIGNAVLLSRFRWPLPINSGPYRLTDSEETHRSFRVEFSVAPFHFAISLCHRSCSDRTNDQTEPSALGPFSIEIFAHAIHTIHTMRFCVVLSTFFNSGYLSAAVCFKLRPNEWNKMYVYEFRRIQSRSTCNQSFRRAPSSVVICFRQDRSRLVDRVTAEK